MNYGIAFTPLVPTIVLWLALAAVPLTLFMRKAGPPPAASGH